MHRFSPHLEILQDREVPAILSTYAAGALSVFSTDTATVDHRVRVLVQDTQIALLIDGQSRMIATSEPLKSINVTTGSGNDVVTINLLSSVRPNAVLAVRVDTGAGDDWIRLRSDQIGSGATVTSKIFAGTGADKIGVTVGTVDPIASVQTHLDLGNDTDRDMANLSAGSIAANSFVGFCNFNAVVVGPGIPASAVDVVHRTAVSPSARVCINGIEQSPVAPSTGSALPSLAPLLVPPIVSKRMLLGSF